MTEKTILPPLKTKPVRKGPPKGQRHRHSVEHRLENIMDVDLLHTLEPWQLDRVKAMMMHAYQMGVRDRSKEE